MTGCQTLMVQGTASSVGKSILVAALCRILRQDGIRVAPFKAQNMSLNSFVTADGGEIGRAQAVQAEAAGVSPTVDMNPVLLKPETDCRSQVIVRGKVWKTLSAREYWDKTREHLFRTVLDSLNRLREQYEAVIIEGAGSPAEINLRDQDIVNMSVAQAVESPVILVGDIDRGGVFASLVGTLSLLLPEERSLVAGMVINKFRGDLALLAPGLRIIEERTGKPVLGVLPYIEGMGIAQEDSVYLDERDMPARRARDIDIDVIWLPHMSNYDDFDPLDRPGVRLRFVRSPEEMGSPQLIILPGTKTTISDLRHIKANGLADCICGCAERGIPVIGICGGYQMLGKRIADPAGVETSEGDEEAGLGLLEAYTRFSREKRTVQVEGHVRLDKGLLAQCRGQRIAGYEIHMGQTRVGDSNWPFELRACGTDGKPSGEGCINGAGNVLGTFVHGLFNSQEFSDGLLKRLAGGCEIKERDVHRWRDGEYDRLANVVRESLNIEEIKRIMQRGT